MSIIRTMKAPSLSLDLHFMLFARNDAALPVVSCRTECPSARFRSPQELLLLSTSQR